MTCAAGTESWGATTLLKAASPAAATAAATAVVVDAESAVAVAASTAAGAAAAAGAPASPPAAAPVAPPVAPPAAAPVAPAANAPERATGLAVVYPFENFALNDMLKFTVPELGTRIKFLGGKVNGLKADLAQTLVQLCDDRKAARLLLPIAR